MLHYYSDKTSHSFYWNSQLVLSIINCGQYVVVIKPCPVCNCQYISNLFYRDKVCNCRSDEIDPTILSVCEECSEHPEDERFIKLIESCSK